MNGHLKDMSLSLGVNSSPDQTYLARQAKRAGRTKLQPVDSLRASQ